MSQSQLPTLAELQLSPDLAFKNDQLNLLLNQPPPSKWVKTHPMLKHQYLPIDKVEYLLTKLFGQWRVEVLSVLQLFNSIAVTVRLHYLHPITGQWSFHDGVGAHNLQLDSGAAPSDLTKIKPMAVMMSLPIAKSAAIKDAADHLGSLFGRDLSRKDTVQFEAFKPASPNPSQRQPYEPSTPQPETNSTTIQF